MTDHNRSYRFAEIVAAALITLDRHEGRESIPWDQQSAHFRAESEKRTTQLITQIEGGSIPTPKNKREALEISIIYNLLVPHSAAMFNEALTKAHRVEEVDPAPQPETLRTPDDQTNPETPVDPESVSTITRVNTDADPAIPVEGGGNTPIGNTPDPAAQPAPEGTVIK